MSLAGRLVIDKLKRAVSKFIKLPCPPYGEPNYWENSYRTLGPTDVNEWGRIGLEQLSKYRYQPVSLSTEQRMAWGIPTNSSNKKEDPTNDDNDAKTDNAYIHTTWGETLQAYPQASADEPILIVGSGNSVLGEEMLQAEWRGPIIQVDISSRVCDAMSIRCAPHLPTGNMQIVQDDATLLSAIADAKVKAVVDKGLLDALFCADEYTQVTDCLRAAHRVLEPGGCLVTFSFSQPDFFLAQLMMHRQQTQRQRPLSWHSVQVRLLDSIYLYRFQKPLPQAMPRYATRKSGANSSNRSRSHSRTR